MKGDETTPVARKVRELVDQSFGFLEEFLKRPAQVASIVPSSRFLERRIVQVAGVDASRLVVELGSGTGGTTRAILRAMLPEARLLSVEINPRFHERIRGIEDDRLIPHLGSAEHLGDVLEAHGLGSPDAVISGIPFSTMSPMSGSRVLEIISSVLAPGGRFVAYQVSRRVDALSRPYFGKAQVDIELFNIPPARVYRWEKSGDGAAPEG